MAQPTVGIGHRELADEGHGELEEDGVGHGLF